MGWSMSVYCNIHIFQGFYTQMFSCVHMQSYHIFIAFILSWTQPIPEAVVFSFSDTQAMFSPLKSQQIVTILSWEPRAYSMVK